ncbi:Glycosyltransferase Family 4 protein [Tuber magnatum]|uniref:Alpha-1,3/1,6-mannosyltransferase ALG2 n=1 Tax=Tuber magnatum TaxID=42249 RepID=A0A317SZU6_9PEZI|nr:Glycosyltransferase Family 4 protein [Tuber magnatum]
MSKKRILFLHPDLGIGGAERLVVDAAVGLQQRGHTVTIYTSHCDKRHCFDEARDGTLDVRVAGNTVVPPNLLGRFSILCAILRQVHLTLTLLLTDEISEYDYIFIDQLSAAIPLLRFFTPTKKVLFYCHFPDYLLATRASFIKSLYRVPFDWFEGFTTGLADTIVVNSAFTRSVFATAFPRIGLVPKVVYPCVTTTTVASPLGSIDNNPPFPNDGRRIILSINRFERKKNIDLAITSYSLLTREQRCRSRLVIAGGYDARVSENVTYHSDLAVLCEKLGLKSATSRNFISSLSVPEDTDVLFLLSIPATLKSYLLKTASLLVYTPAREHFGIVPLEAMIAGVPVLAHNSGGPLETIQEGKTGWLRPAEDEQWAAVMRTALFELEEKVIVEMATRGRERVLELFSKEKMAERLDGEFDEISDGRSIRGLVLTVLAGMGAVIGLGVAFALGS